MFQTTAWLRDGLLLVAADGNILGANIAAAARLQGSAVLEGANLLDLVAPGTDPLPFLQSCVRTTGPLVGVLKLGENGKTSRCRTLGGLCLPFSHREPVVLLQIPREIGTDPFLMLNVRLAARNNTSQARRVVEGNLRVSQERFRDLVENINDLVQTVSTEGQFLYVNRTWCSTLGYEPGEAARMTIWDVVHPDSADDCHRLFELIAAGQDVGPFELDYCAKDGRRISLEGKSSVVLDGGRVTLSRTILRDITQRKRAEEARLKVDEQMQHAQRMESLGVLAGGIAHDFNNLLTGILGYCDLAQLSLKTDSDAYGHLARAISGAREAARVTQQMLAYAGKGRFLVRPLCLSDEVREVTRLLEISIPKKCILRYELMPDLPACEADAAQIRQVMMNLVINAAEAIGSRSGVISVTTGIMRCDRAYLAESYLDDNLPEGFYVYVEVADNGSGMSAETRARLFEPFFTTKVDGRGLGLSAVMGIVRGHRGALKVYSEIHRGSTFKFLLPVAEAAVDAVRPPGGSEATTWRGSGLVLVIDDEESIRGLARYMLEMMGFEVLSAVDGKEGVEAFRQRSEDIRFVLLDMAMPHLDGEQTYRELRRIRGDVRAILCSGFNEQSATSRFAGKGLAGFLQKPYTFDVLRSAVRHALKEQAGEGGGEAFFEARE